MFRVLGVDVDAEGDELQKWFRQLDKESGALDFDEFVKLYVELKAQRTCTLAAATAIMSKRPHERTAEELQRLANFMSSSVAFFSYLNRPVLIEVSCPSSQPQVCCLWLCPLARPSRHAWSPCPARPAAAALPCHDGAATQARRVAVGAADGRGASRRTARRHALCAGGRRHALAAPHHHPAGPRRYGSLAQVQALTRRVASRDTAAHTLALHARDAHRAASQRQATMRSVKSGVDGHTTSPSALVRLRSIARGLGLAEDSKALTDAEHPGPASPSSRANLSRAKSMRLEVQVPAAGGSAAHAGSSTPHSPKAGAGTPSRSATARRVLLPSESKISHFNDAPASPGAPLGVQGSARAGRGAHASLTHCTTLPCIPRRGCADCGLASHDAAAQARHHQAGDQQAALQHA